MPVKKFHLDESCKVIPSPFRLLGRKDVAASSQGADSNGSKEMSRIDVDKAAILDFSSLGKNAWAA